jgi:hypothetical protein
MLDLDKFVEATLIGFELDSVMGQVVFAIREPSGKLWHLVASGVSDLNISEMRLQNIIDRISVWKDCVDMECKEKISSLIGNMFYTHLPAVGRIVGAIQRGESMLIELEPVYGASVLMLASGLSVSEG